MSALYKAAQPLLAQLSAIMAGILTASTTGDGAAGWAVFFALQTIILAILSTID